MIKRARKATKKGALPSKKPKMTKKTKPLATGTFIAAIFFLTMLSPSKQDILPLPRSLLLKNLTFTDPVYGVFNNASGIATFTDVDADNFGMVITVSEGVYNNVVRFSATRISKTLSYTNNIYIYHPEFARVIGNQKTIEVDFKKLNITMYKVSKLEFNVVDFLQGFSLTAKDESGKDEAGYELYVGQNNIEEVFQAKKRFKIWILEIIVVPISLMCLLLLFSIQGQDTVPQITLLANFYGLIGLLMLMFGIQFFNEPVNVSSDRYFEYSSTAWMVVAFVYAIYLITAHLRLQSNEVKRRRFYKLETFVMIGLTSLMALGINLTFRIFYTYYFQFIPIYFVFETCLGKKSPFASVLTMLLCGCQSAVYFYVVYYPYNDAQWPVVVFPRTKTLIAVQICLYAFLLCTIVFNTIKNSNLFIGSTEPGAEIIDVEDEDE